MQALAESGREFEDALVPGDQQHLSRAVLFEDGGPATAPGRSRDLLTGC